MTTPLPRHSAFFLDVSPGQRFCLFHSPQGNCCGAVVYIHPFAEEMNKSRRTAAAQGRALAAAGFAVLQIDLLGCGDSSGDFAEARWDLWKKDIEAAISWLNTRFDQPVTLLGLRLGALLGLDVACSTNATLHRLVLWNPVLNGAAFLKQFLRLLSVNEMLAEAGEDKSSPVNAKSELLAGRALEIAGYELAPALALAIETCDAANFFVTACPIEWIETVPSLERPVAPSITRLTESWVTNSVEVTFHRVVGPSFWATQEIEESPVLIETTTAVLLNTAVTPLTPAES